jgi:hypothetical protein
MCLFPSISQQKYYASTTNGYHPNNAHLLTSDPELIAQLEKYGKVEQGRVYDFGQMRYAMRSALMHAPYIRNFIVVVSSKETQIPSWLDTTHPRVRVVEHEEIWDNPTWDLPSMNSNAIEWNMINIPDLAPLFLYFNDDFAIQTKLELSTIYPGPDRFVLWEAWEAPFSASGASDTYGKSLAFVRSLYNVKYGNMSSRKVASHVPILFNTTVMKMIKADFPKEFEEMFHENPFRTNHNIQLQFAYQQYIRQHFFHVRADKPWHFKDITTDFEKNKNTFDNLKKNPRQFMCLQDGAGGNGQPWLLDQVKDFYEEIFPTRGPWEKSW